MNQIRAVIEFLHSYPDWAKILMVVALLVIMLVLTLVPRGAGGNGKAPDTPDQGSTVLSIQGVKLFPATEGDLVQVQALVNGTIFQYPSLAGISWLEVGPDMPTQVFQLPRSERYEVRFEVLKKANLGQTKKMVSQSVVTVAETPASGEYNVYPIDGNIHATRISGAVEYSVTLAK